MLPVADHADHADHAEKARWDPGSNCS